MDIYCICITRYDETLWYSMDLTGFSFSETVLTRLLTRGVVVLRLAWAEVRNLKMLFVFCCYNCTKLQL